MQQRLLSPFFRVETEAQSSCITCARLPVDKWQNCDGNITCDINCYDLTVTGKFGHGVWNEAGQRLIEFCQENALVITNTLFQQHKEDSTHEHHQMVNTKVRLIIFFAAKDGEALYNHRKQDRELTVAQIMNSLLPNSELN